MKLMDARTSSGAALFGLLLVVALVLVTRWVASPPEAEVLGVVLTADGAVPVASQVLDDTLHWGSTDGGCVGIGEAVSVARNEYVLRTEVRPGVESDCPTFESSYATHCAVLLQAPTDHAARMVGDLKLEMFVNGATRSTWTIPVDEVAEPGREVVIRPLGDVTIEGQPHVACRATFTAA